MMISSGQTPCLAIRRETHNAWERRAPLTPVHVKKLVKKGIRVLIQPSNRRAFPIQDYVAVGAIVQEDLSEAQLIMTVKAVPIQELIPEKTYAFFSHTIKAQTENMPLLDAVLHRKIRLIDYEKMVNSKGKRIVMFGKWAGFTGIISLFHGLGLRLLALGHNTPFLHIGLAHNYSNSHMAINAVRDAGYEIALNKMPHSVGPLVFIFTGSGNVSRGAQEVFRHLPHEYVDVSMLPKIAMQGELNKVYGCVVSRADHIVHKAGSVYDPEEFEQHPERYVSKFATEIAPYASVIINGIFWGPKMPRLLTISDAKRLLTPNVKQSLDVPGCPTLPHRLIALCDISADPCGSIEFMTACTTIDKPFKIYDADLNQMTDNLNVAKGCLICSIDNLPAQMPVEASEQFGSLLLPYIPDMLNCSTNQHFDRLACCDEVKKAIITTDGKLTPNFQYINRLRLEKPVATEEVSRSSKYCDHEKATRTSDNSQLDVLCLGAEISVVSHRVNQTQG
uniref:Saccharopine dehydrogenase (NAD(+), L-glutamate-forming) n=1 Tax=Plectus sambesii TaxID=2011161 RepID=A0A914VUB3_9BILA